jgi:hypothetical protein
MSQAPNDPLPHLGFARMRLSESKFADARRHIVFDRLSASFLDPGVEPRSVAIAACVRPGCFRAFGLSTIGST